MCVRLVDVFPLALFADSFHVQHAVRQVDVEGVRELETNRDCFAHLHCRLVQLNMESDGITVRYYSAVRT